MAELTNRKVFFLHPQAVVQDDLARGLIEDNYECYLVRNAASAKTALREYPNGILMIQVDSGLEESQWFTYADEIKTNPVFMDATLCVLSVKAEESIRKTFFPEGSPFDGCFSYGNFNYEATLTRIKEFLENQKARPPRYLIRGVSPEGHEVSLIFVRDSNRYEGQLRDITLAGLTCRIGQETLLPSEVPIQNIIITYGSTQFSVSGKIAGKHGSEDSLHLILMDEWTKEEKRAEIYDLVQACLQAEIKTVIDAKSHKRQIVTKTPRSALYRKKN